jgi:hypothetical protein
VQLTRAISFATLVACAEPPARQADPVPVDQLRTRLIEATCARGVRCGVFASESSCEDYYSTPYGDEPWIADAVAVGSILYDPQAAGDCFAWLANQSCDPSLEGVRVRPDACLEMYRPQRHATETCFIDEECVSGICGNRIPEAAHPDCAAGSCAANPPPLAPSPLYSEGVPCNSDTDCAYSLVCSFSATASTFVCTKSPALGEPCLYQRGCVDEGLTCDPTTMLCVALRAEGEACDPNGAQCRVDLQCDSTMHCGPLPGDGQSCGQTGACDGLERCNWDGVTQTRLCAAPKPDGDACIYTTECASGFCGGPSSATVCKPWPVCE